MKVGLISSSLTSWATDLFLISGLEVVFPEIDRAIYNSNINFNQYQLPLKDSEILVITSESIVQIKREGKINSDHFFRELRKSFTKIYCLDVSDTFELHLTPEEFQYFDRIIKCQGIYKDRELYNFKVGTRYHGGNWTQKNRPKADSFTNKELDKLILGPPCFLAIDNSVRSSIRKVRPGISNLQVALRWLADESLEMFSRFSRYKKPTYDCHFIGSMTHYQRKEIVESLKKKVITGKVGLTNVPEYIYGLPGDQSQVTDELRRQIENELTQDNLLVSPINRIKYLKDMVNHKIIVAPCGYGELSFRQAEALKMKRALISQDLSHVETMFPFKEDGNILFIKADLSNFEEKVSCLIEDQDLTKRIANKGFQDWKEWTKDHKSLLWKSFGEQLF